MSKHWRIVVSVCLAVLAALLGPPVSAARWCSRRGWILPPAQ
jgi:hypothetical protein